MAVIEGVCRIVGGVDPHKDLHVATIVDEQDPDHWNAILRHDSAGLSPNAGLDALLRSAATRIGIEVDRQLWCRASCASCNKQRSRSSRSRLRTSRIGVGVARTTISTRRTPPMPAFAGQRTVTPRSPGRHDRDPLRVLKGLPEDGGERQAYRPADDPQHDRLRPRWPARSTAQPHPHATLIRTLASWRPDLTAYRDPDSRLSHRPPNPSPAVTSSCHDGRSQISTR